MPSAQQIIGYCPLLLSETWPHTYTEVKYCQVELEAVFAYIDPLLSVDNLLYVQGIVMNILCAL